MTVLAREAEVSAIRPGTRRALGWVAPVGPIGMAVWSLAIPYHVMDKPEVWIPAVGADSGRIELSLWGLLLFAATAGVGAIVTGLVACRGSYRLGATGLAMTFLGFSALSFGSGTTDGAAVAAHSAGVDLATTERIIDELGGLQASMASGILFVPLNFFGMVLLGIALWRGRTVPRWAAAVTLAAMPVVLIGGYAAMWINAAGFLLMAIGFGAAGRVFARGSTGWTEVL